MSDRIVQITKKYIIDLLNSLCFANTICWDGADSYNSFPIFREITDTDQMEQRGFFLVDTRKPHALRVLVTAQDLSLFKVCYRVQSIKEPIAFDNPSKMCYPMEGVSIDFSIADLNVGAWEVSSYSFSDNTNVDQECGKVKLFNFTKFLLSSAMVTKEEPELFQDMLYDLVSQIPVVGESHYKPVFEASQCETI